MLSLENLSIVVTGAGSITDYTPRQERQFLYMELVAEYVLKIIKLFFSKQERCFAYSNVPVPSALRLQSAKFYVLFSKTYFVEVMRH